MTAIADATAVANLLIGRTLTGPELNRIGDAYFAADPHSLIRRGVVVIADPENPTNEEKAQLFLDSMLHNARAILRHTAEQSETEAVDGQVSAAGDAAVNDLT